MRKPGKGKRKSSPKQPLPPVKTKAGKENLRLPALVIALVGFVLYINTLNHGFVLDDNSAIENNWLVKQGSQAIPELLKTSYRHGFWKGEDELYRPLPLCIFAVMWDLFPENPVPFHLLNILLYSLSGFLLYILLRKMLIGYSVWLPFIASLIFMAHPVHTEVVANIKSLDEILSLLFILISLWLLFKYAESRSALLPIVAACTYFLSLLARESSITMLAIFPLILFFFSGMSRSKIIGITSLMLVPAIAYLLIRSQVLGAVTSTKSFAFIDNILYSAPDTSTRLATALSILLKYLFLLFFPVTLSSDYTYPQIELNGWESPASWISLLLHAALFIYALLNLRKKNLISFIILFYLFSISVFSNIFVLIGSPFAERFLYIPSIAFALFCAWLIMKITRHPVENTTSDLKQLIKNPLPASLVLIITIAFSARTLARNPDWKSNYDLFKADSFNSPRSARIHYFYANEIRKQKAMKAATQEEKTAYLHESIKEYNRSVELYPDYADPWGQMGMSYYRLGDRKKAFELYTKSISLSTLSSTVYNNMGVLYSEAGQHKEALEYYKKAVFYDPYYFDGWKNLGNTYAELGDHPKSIEAFNNALKYKADDAETNFYLAIELEMSGRQSEADIFYNKASAINPSLARPVKR